MKHHQMLKHYCNHGTASSRTNRSVMPYHPSRPVTGSVAVKWQVESLVSILVSSCLLSTQVALSEREPFMLLAF